MVVSWTTLNDLLPSTVKWWGATESEERAHSVSGEATAYSQLVFLDPELTEPGMGRPGADEKDLLAMQDTTSWAFDPFNPGQKGSAYHEATEVEMGLGEYKNPQEIYNSPLIHRTLLSNLSAGETYRYRVSGDGRDFSFTMPPAAGAAFPYTIGLTADLGQTLISDANVATLRQRMGEAQPFAGFVLLSGDLAYADGYFSRWDSFGRLIEKLAAEVPLMTTGGNHEIGTAEAWLSYNSRYVMPFRASGSASNLWWSMEAGPVHVIALCSYAATHAHSLQYRWLVRDLKRVDRSRTPWLIVMFHAPWYNSNSGHVGESELMRRDMETLLCAANYEHGVDIILCGHVHAYERTHPVFKGCVNGCGPVYLNLGDGGNREGAYLPWRMAPPAWTAFRESSFGVGMLTLHNATHALYNWTRSACEGANEPGHMNFNASCETIVDGVLDNSKFSTVASDVAWLVRPLRRVPAACAARSCEAPPPSPSPSPSPSPLPRSQPETAAPMEARFSTAIVLLAAGFGVVIGLSLAQLAPLALRAAFKLCSTAAHSEASKLAPSFKKSDEAHFEANDL